MAERTAGGASITSGGAAGPHSPFDTAHGIEHEAAEAFIDDDYTTGIVPLEKRRSNFTMFLLWATLQASVSIMYTGYLARTEGLTLGQLFVACGVSLAAIFAYGVGAANIGSATGQTHTLLTRTIFGRAGSAIVSILLIIMGMGWYGFQARFMAELLNGLGLFGAGLLTLWSVIFGIVMITNNLFGFRGVSAYARWVAGPILIAWGAYATIKGFAKVPSHALFASPHVAVTTTVLVVAGLIIGGAAWGNEPDIFRYSRMRPWWNVPTLFVGYAIGIFLFPLAGYLMAELSSATDFGPIVKEFVAFSLFGLTALAVIVFFVNQFALNDGNLYEAVNALQNLLGWRRIYSVLVFGAIGAVLAAEMTQLQKDFFIVAGISAIFVPCATTIMAIDVFVLPRLFGLQRRFDRVTPWTSTALINWVGIGSLLVALAVGSYTGGLIPGIHGFGTTNIGFPALQSWGIAAGLYLAGTWLVLRRADRDVLLGFPTDHAEALPAAAAEPAAV